MNKPIILILIINNYFTVYSGGKALITVIQRLMEIPLSSITIVGIYRFYFEAYGFISFSTQINKELRWTTP